MVRLPEIGKITVTVLRTAKMRAAGTEAVQTEEIPETAGTAGTQTAAGTTAVRTAGGIAAVRTAAGIMNRIPAGTAAIQTEAGPEIRAMLLTDRVTAPDIRSETTALRLRQWYLRSFRSS